MQAIERLRRRLVNWGKRPIAASSRFWSNDRPWLIVIALSFVLLIVSQTVEMVKTDLIATVVFLALIVIWFGIMVVAWRRAPQTPPSGESAIPAPNPPATREGASNAP